MATPHGGGQDAAENRTRAVGPVFAGVVALDGPSGTGKSTVARRLAGRFRARYLDTGAMYRAATLAVLAAGEPDASPAEMTELVRAARIEITTDPDHIDVRLDGVSVSREIRSAEVTAAVSAVSAIPAVRTLLVDQQRAIIGAGGIVVEGRDIASVVYPDADPKIYLTASADVRARRRAGELGATADVRAVLSDLERRDRLDSSRTTSPFSQAGDAVEVDTTHLDIDEVVNRLVDMVLSTDGVDAGA